MVNFIKGKIKPSEIPQTQSLFGASSHIQNNELLVLSSEAQEVFDAGRELWKYYHAQEGVNVNAALYDIKEHFQGRNGKGKMNNKSEDESYNEKLSLLRNRLNILAKKTTPKIFEYGFLIN